MRAMKTTEIQLPEGPARPTDRRGTEEFDSIAVKEEREKGKLHSAKFPRVFKPGGVSLQQTHTHKHAHTLTLYFSAWSQQTGQIRELTK